MDTSLISSTVYVLRHGQNCLWGPLVRGKEAVMAGV